MDYKSKGGLKDRKRPAGTPDEKSNPVSEEFETEDLETPTRTSPEENDNFLSEVNPNSSQEVND